MDATRRLDALTDLIAELGLRGCWIDVTDDGQRLVVDGPTAALSVDVRERLAEAKPALLHALAPDAREPLDGESDCPSCGGPCGGGSTGRCPGCVARSWRAVLTRPGRVLGVASRRDASSSEGDANEPTAQQDDGTLPLFDHEGDAADAEPHRASARR